MNDRPVEAMHFDPNEGIPLKHALTYFAAYPPHYDANGTDIARHLSKLHLLGRYRPGHELALSDVDRHRGEGARTVLSYTLVTRLRQGELCARAFTPGGVALVDIPPQWWQRVILDFDANTAEANGTKITGVMVFEAICAVNAAAVPPVPPANRPVAVGELREWYVARASNWPAGQETPGEGDDLADAKAHFPNNAISREVIRNMRRENAPAEWTKQGRRREITP